MDIVNVADEAACQRELPSLLVLNDDCLELVLMHLPVMKQFRMLQLHSRLHNVVHLIWRLHLKNGSFTERDFVDFTDDEFLSFMINISPHVEILTLCSIRRERFKLLKRCTFERVHTLTCIDPYRASRIHGMRYGREEVRILKNNFPNLQALKVKGFHITNGRKLFGMKNLKRLHLNFL